MIMEPSLIKKLDQAVINRIAAGEVIQRPANALKEMIENSIDAKSTNIQISVKNGGLKCIQIQDNGCGIRKEDFGIVCERFTTSKLRNFEDLSSIATYGFRGEALASISHVAHLILQSKTCNDKCAYRASYQDGKLIDEPKATAGNQGTQITVEDLFYNMNIRKQALKSAAEEYQKISDVVGKYAIHNPNIGFGLKKHSESNDIRTPANSNYIDNIRTIYGNIIARELIQFSMENKPFKFKVHGYLTNVNYSTKKFIFLLFINNRLVDCQGLKKCIDQIYTTYLPKHSHPFVYLSLELNPNDVDVNVHPTKHEVHFLHEDQIINAIAVELETKLLGSNNSRVFYAQAKLPCAPVTNTKENITEKIVYDKNFVRTDATEQKLEKFFGSPIRKSDQQNTIVENDKDVDVANQKSDNRAIDKNVIDRNSVLRTAKKTTSVASKITRTPCDLTSIMELRKDLDDNCNKTLRELFAQHVFVGSIDSTQALIQHSTKLYLCNTFKIMRDLFYQCILYNFQNFGFINLSEPLPLYNLALLALDLEETGWSEEDGDKNELAKKVAEILTEKGEMLLEYFSIEIDDYGNLKSLPLILDNHIPEMAGLPMYILRLATEVQWDSEKECFHAFAYETSKYYAQLRQENKIESTSWTWTTEHVFYPAIKEYFLPPKSYTENAAVLQIANLPDLYKVFERC